MTENKGEERMKKRYASGLKVTWVKREGKLFTRLYCGFACTCCEETEWRLVDFASFKRTNTQEDTEDFVTFIKSRFNLALSHFAFDPANSPGENAGSETTDLERTESDD